MKELEEKKATLEEKLEEIQEEKTVVVATSTKNIQVLKQTSEEQNQQINLKSNKIEELQ